MGEGKRRDCGSKEKPYIGSTNKDKKKYNVRDHGWFCFVVIGGERTLLVNMEVKFDKFVKDRGN